MRKMSVEAQAVANGGFYVYECAYCTWWTQCSWYSFTIKWMKCKNCGWEGYQQKKSVR